MCHSAKYLQAPAYYLGENSALLSLHMLLEKHRSAVVDVLHFDGDRDRPHCIALSTQG